MMDRPATKMAKMPSNERIALSVREGACLVADA